MKHGVLSVVAWLCLATSGRAQQITTSGLLSINQLSSPGSVAYTVQGTTPEREQLLRAQIQVMQPAILPTRIIFAPHWQYVYATKMYLSFAKIPSGRLSRTDRCAG